jgi:predicted nucleic acid-binding Zn ribbon protein
MCPGSDERARGGGGARRRERRDPDPMGTALHRALEGLDLDRVSIGADIGARWLEIVGADVAQHCRPVGMRSGVLYVEVESSAWCQQLQLRTPELQRALRGALGERAPAEVRFRVGYSPEP